MTDLAIYALYVGIFMAPVEQLINFTETLQKGYAGFRRFIEVLAERPDVATKPGAPTLAEAGGGEGSEQMNSWMLALRAASSISAWVAPGRP